MEKLNLTENEIITLKTAIEMEKKSTPEYICTGRAWKQFIKLSKLGLIHKDTLKYTGVIRLTIAGRKFVTSL